MSTFLNRNPYRRSRRASVTAGFDPVLTGAVALLLVIGTLLVYAATREWYSANGLDPQYYLKRHVINIVIGLALAWGTTIIDYRLLRAYTPFIWVAGVLGLILVLIPGVGSEINGAKAWIPLPGGFQIQPAEIAKISIIIGISMLLSERTHNSDEPTNQDVLKALAVAAIQSFSFLRSPTWELYSSSAHPLSPFLRFQVHPHVGSLAWFSLHSSAVSLQRKLESSVITR
jgi:rod shape determining protein RodA